MATRQNVAGIERRGTRSGGTERFAAADAGRVLGDVVAMEPYDFGSANPAAQ